MNPVHLTLTPLLSLPQVTGIRIAFLSEDTPNRNHLYAWMPSRHLKQFFYQFIKHCDIAIQAIKQTDSELFFIFEHKPHYSLVLYLALILIGKPVFFLVHGLQQLHTKSTFHSAGFKLLQYLVTHFSFFPIHIEKDDFSMCPSVRFRTQSKLTIPLPHPLTESIALPICHKWRQSRFRVGVVGMFRPDKPTQKLIETLLLIQQFNNSFDLVVGTPFWQIPSWIGSLDVELVDTSDEIEYSKLLAGIHISVQDFSKDDYFFRPSGTINDAGMHECFVLCPDFPVFQAQINTPVVVGAIFQSHHDLAELLPSVLASLRDSTPDFATWKSYRSMTRIAPALSTFMKSKVKI